MTMGWVLPTIQRELGRVFVPSMASFNRNTTISAVDLVVFCEAQGYAANVPGMFNRNILQLKPKLTIYLGNTVTANGVALTMAVQPTTVEPPTAAAARQNGHFPTEEEVEAVLEHTARVMGYNDVNDFQLARDSGPMPAIQMQCHENNALLAASGDQYPFFAQFVPEDAEAEIGLHFDPTGLEVHEAFHLDDFVDFTTAGFVGNSL
jgi:hypothetical protein